MNFSCDRSIFLALLTITLAACSGDDTATTTASTSDGTSPTTSETTGSTTEGTTEATTEATTAATTQGSASDSTTAGTTDATTTVTAGTTEGTTDATTAGTTDATTTTTEGTTEGTTDGTTGGDICAFPGSEAVSADLKDLSEKVVCGTLLFNGTVGSKKDQTWELDNCPCDSECFVEDPWTLTVDVPPGLEPQLPVCARIEVVTVQGFAPDTCELVSMTIWDTTGDINNKEPFYAAGRTLDYSAPPFAVKGNLLGECECDFCCGKSEAYDLTFSVGDAQITLAEATMGAIDGEPKVEAHNFQSHLSGLCDAPPDVHWLMRATP